MNGHESGLKVKSGPYSVMAAMAEGLPVVGLLALTLLAMILWFWGRKEKQQGRGIHKLGPDNLQVKICEVARLGKPFHRGLSPALLFGAKIVLLYPYLLQKQKRATGANL